MDGSATSQSADGSSILYWPRGLRCATSVLHNTGIARHWSPFQERNAGVWPGKEGCAWTYWKSYTGVAVPSSWPRAIPRSPTPQNPPRDPRTRKRTVLCGQEKVQLQHLPCLSPSSLYSLTFTVSRSGWINSRTPLKMLLRLCPGQTMRGDTCHQPTGEKLP